MKLAEPPGVRSCREGGEWSCCREAGTDRNLPIDEFHQKVLKIARSKDDRVLLQQELLALMKRAERGSLKFGRDGQVDFMVTTRHILELRLITRTGERGDERLVRLYFSEPAHMDHLLLAVLVAAKHPGPMSAVEQSNHAQSAQIRLDRWAQNGSR